MMIMAKLKKEGRLWSVSCPDVFAETSADTKKGAIENIAWWFRDMLEMENYEVFVKETGKNLLSITFPDPLPVIGLILSQIRSFSGYTLDAAGKLTNRHRSGVRQMESGKHDPGVGRLNKTLNDYGYEMVVQIKKRA